MPAPIPANGLGTARLPRSERVLLLVDFINPLDFPGGEKFAPVAVAAARATAGLKKRLAGEGVAAVYANDNYGVWHSDFHQPSDGAAGAGVRKRAGVVRA